MILIFLIMHISEGYAVAKSVDYATSRKVAGSIPDKVIGFLK
jgi:hypothetical protein